MSETATGKVFGIGLSRTGTVTLTVCLDILGYDSVHAPLPLFIKDGLAETIKKHDAFTDSEVAYQYKELDKLFPNSKFILTVRPAWVWLRSYETYFLREEIIHENWRELLFKLYGSRTYDEEKFRAGYIKHNKEVEEYFKDRPNDLLVIEFGKDYGWIELCKFLKKPIPMWWIEPRTKSFEKRWAFPHHNPNSIERKKHYNLLNRKNKWRINESKNKTKNTIRRKRTSG